MDKEVSAAGYLLTFFNDIEKVTNSFANYCNLLADCKGNYPTQSELKKLDQQKKDEIKAITQETRFWINRTYVKFSALKAKLSEFENNEQIVTEAYEKLIEQQTPEFSELKKYVIELNKLFVLEVVDTLLTKSTDIYAQYTSNA